MLRNAKEELLQVCGNQNQESCMLPCVATLRTVDHLNQRDVILKSLRVYMSAERSRMLATIDIDSEFSKILKSWGVLEFACVIIQYTEIQKRGMLYR